MSAKADVEPITKRAPATAHLDPADAVPVLFPNRDGTAGTILAGDLRALTQYIERRDNLGGASC